MNTFEWIGKIFSEYWNEFLRGMGNTLIMALTGTAIGFLIGLAVAIVRTIPLTENDSKFKRVSKKIIDVILTAYVEIIRGTPMLVQALIIHYGFFVSLNMHPLISAIIIISFNTGAYMAEIVRGGIISVDKGQVEGAHAIGMNHWQTMTNVILPQAIRNIMPSIGNEFVVNIKDSSVLSVISITELMFISKQAGGAYAQFVPSYLICALIYLILTFTITRILRLLEKKMEGGSSYMICGSQSDPDAQIRVVKEKDNG
ncbi:MAG: amino acid ABC transporter permease [Clostridia bacterium]|nr:amino acid ABC transporter permease [Clostridia bacterium]